MAPVAQFRILGPLEVRIAGEPVHVTAPRERTTLAALLLEPGKLVSVDRLVDVVWAQNPPAAPANQLAICVSALRRKFARAGDGSGGELIVTAPPGYLLRTRDCELDTDSVDHLVAEAQRLAAEEAPETAVERLSAALELWRGPVLSGITSQSLQPEIVRWEERRLELLEQRIQLQLDLGRSYELIGELFATIADQPLRERPRAQLMVALCRAGRRSEALAVYADLRKTLRNELGLEPDAELRALHEDILRGKLGAVPRPPARAARPAAAPGSGVTVQWARAARTVPAMLPTDIADFTNRTAELDALCAAFTGGHGTAVPVALVCGPAGIGKTALAVHAAHTLRDLFPGGQLYADLRGTQQHPADPSEILGRFLRALGYNGRLIPDGLDQRADVYRGLLAEQQVLVVLDDAADEEQLRLLLPGTASCGVLATSRGRLTGLAGVRLVDLDIFEPDPALGLLRAILGGERVDREPAAAAELARHCGRLPLAVRIAGARLAAKPHWTLASFVSRLAEEHKRLDELSHGALEVRASLALSYHGLPPVARWLFCRLGMLSAPDFAAWTGVPLLDAEEPEAAAAFESLVDAQLLVADGAGPAGEPRYHFHDLVRLYAREQFQRDEPAEAQEAAAARLMDAWLDLVQHAHLAMSGGGGLIHDASPKWRFDPDHAARLTADPSAWYEAERLGLLATIRQAAERGFDGLCWELVTATTPLLREGGHFQEWRETHEQALVAALRSDDRYGQAAVLTGLGELLVNRLQFQAGAEHLHRAVRIFTELGESHGAALASIQLACANATQGRYPAALATYRSALALLESVGDRESQGRVHQLIGQIHLELCHPDLAEPHLRSADRLAGRTGDANRARALFQFGKLYAQRGDLDRAQHAFETVFASCDSRREARGKASALTELGRLHLSRRSHQQADACLRQALAITRETADWPLKLDTDLAMADLAFGQRRFEQAVAILREGIRSCRRIGVPICLGRYLQSLGRVHEAMGAADLANLVRREALDVFSAIGSAQVDLIRRQLTGGAAAPATPLLRT